MIARAVLALSLATFLVLVFLAGARDHQRQEHDRMPAGIVLEFQKGARP